MKGIEEAKKFYLEHGRDMLASEFGEYVDRIAVGLVGHGSECFGYDDDISRDHDYEVGFCMWLTDEDEQEVGFRLMRAYQRLKSQYGVKKTEHMSVLGGSAEGVHTISDFYRRYTGCDGAPSSWRDWLYTDSFYFAEATNGEVFCDSLGEFSKVRNEILFGMPDDVRKKKIATCALNMAQCGQYNYQRCLAHGESGASMLALSRFVNSASEMIFLLNRRHMPYYKWVFRAMRDLPLFADLCAPLEFLLTAENDEKTQAVKKGIVEDICLAVSKELKKQGLATCEGNYLEPYAYEINKSIKLAELRNLYL